VTKAISVKSHYPGLSVTIVRTLFRFTVEEVEVDAYLTLNLAPSTVYGRTFGSVFEEMYVELIVLTPIQLKVILIAEESTIGILSGPYAPM